MPRSSPDVTTHKRPTASSADLYEFDNGRTRNAIQEPLLPDTEVHLPGSPSRQSEEPSPDRPMPNRRTASSSRRFARFAVKLALLAGLLAAGAVYGLPKIRELMPQQTTQNRNLVLETAKRAPLRITVTDRGTLDSLKNATLTSRVEGKTTIISIVPEGTFVKAGEIVCELDSSVLREQAKQQEIVLTQARATLSQASENLAIQKTQNESDIAAADLNLKLAQLDLEKFQRGDFLQQKNEIAGQITIAHEDLTRAQENYEFTKRIAKKGYRSQNDLEADRIAVTKAEIAYKVAEEKLAVLEDYTYKRTIAELQAKAQELVREIDRVKRKANAALAQFEAEFNSRKLTAEVEEHKYNRLTNQIEACTLRAPQDGEVVYASQTGRRSSESVIIEVGAQVHERQSIIKLPDVTNMKVDARIHESKIGRLKSGQRAVIRVDAYPGEEFHGVLETVSSVPVSGSFPNYDLKEYETTIRITDEVERVSRLRPGLTAEIEILVNQRSNILQAPIQAVVSIGSRMLTYVATPTGPERRDVVVGETNDVVIEIVDGVMAGDRVVLNPRTHFADELNELESKHAHAAADEAASRQDAADRAAASPESADGSPRAVKPDSGQSAAPANPHAGGRPDPAASFARFDKDGSGSLTSDELPAAMQARFAELDANGDGSLDPEEWKAGSASIRPNSGSSPPAGSAL